MDNLATIIISIVLLVAIVLVLGKMIRDKKQGKSSCGCGCSSCTMNKTCHKKNDEKVM